MLKLAAVAAVAAVSLSGCDFSVYSLPLPGGPDLGDNPITVHAKFHDVLDLVPQSTVKVGDVTVGSISDIRLDGYTADVTMQLKRSVDLPDNAVARIRQTSLLGEKFVSLSPPLSAAASNRLGNGDVIPLDRTGRNPEVEEVLGALSLLLNGGGVAQLKTITTELNKVFSGREDTVRSVLDRLNTFTTTLDKNKKSIVDAIESLNRLAISLNKQQGTIEATLDRMPQALATINQQRDGLVKMLTSLKHLSGVATHVIKASKSDTIASLRELEPVLAKLKQAGSAFPRSLQVALTYPFVDEVVGRNPVQARNLHMGDYTNLSVHLVADLSGKTTPVIPGVPGVPVNPNPTLSQAQKCLKAIQNNAGQKKIQKLCVDVTKKVKKQICKNLPKSALKQALCGTKKGSGGGGGGGLPPLPLPTLPGLSGDDGGLLRAAVNGDWPGAEQRRPDGPGEHDYDTTLGGLLVQGMVQR